MLKERTHADLGILGAEHFDESVLFEGETVFERTIEACVDDPLRHRLSGNRAGCVGGGQLDRALEHRIGAGRIRLDELVDQTD